MTSEVKFDDCIRLIDFAISSGRTFEYLIEKLEEVELLKTEKNTGQECRLVPSGPLGDIVFKTFENGYYDNGAHYYVSQLFVTPSGEIFLDGLMDAWRLIDEQKKNA